VSAIYLAMQPPWHFTGTFCPWHFVRDSLSLVDLFSIPSVTLHLHLALSCFFMFCNFLSCIFRSCICSRPDETTRPWHMQLFAQRRAIKNLVLFCRGCTQSSYGWQPQQYLPTQHVTRTGQLQRITTVISSP